MSLYTQEQLHTIASKIKDIPFCMFTTSDASHVLSSRPLTTQQIDEEGNMWFFTSDEAAFTHELEFHPGVNLSFSDPGHSIYLSVYGRAQLLRNRDKAKELWNPKVRSWFPGGLDDPHLALIQVRIQTAEYWDASSSKMKQLIAKARSTLTGERIPMAGTHTTICL
jgi:general stress protein 26